MRIQDKVDISLDAEGIQVFIIWVFHTEEWEPIGLGLFCLGKNIMELILLLILYPLALQYIFNKYVYRSSVFFKHIHVCSKQSKRNS